MQGNVIQAGSSIIKLLLEEAEAMITHALGSGMQIPAEMVRHMENYRACYLQLEAHTEHGQSINHPYGTLNSDDLAEGLTRIHNELARIISPASPRAILLLRKEETIKSPLKVFGPVPLIRHVMIASLIFLLGFVFISLSPDVNTQNIEAGLFASEGLPLLLNLLFLLSAAGLGACFSALFKANSYVVSGTYEPRYEATYWARISLGLIAGLLLATLIPVNEEAGDWTKLFGKPLLALLGGFSAALLYRILNRLVSTVESLIAGETKDLIRFNEQRVKNKADEEQIQSRIKTARQLMKIQSKLNAGSAPGDINQDMINVIDDIMQSDRRQIEVKSFNSVSTSNRDSTSKPKTESQKKPEDAQL